MTPFPGATPMKPGSCAYPSFGIEPVLLHAESGKEIPFVPGQTSSGVLAIKQPWPGLCRGVFGDPQRFKNTYFDPYPGYYFTGDGASRDGDGLITITGRTDDVVNVSGHRIGTAEVESALVLDKRVSEAAVVGVNHEVKGSALFCFVILKADVPLPRDSAGWDKLVKELKGMVRQEIGPFATPDSLVITPHLPKTRSGKLMRRLLRKVAAGETDIKSFGDLSTLAEPHVVEELIEAVQKLRK
jgi:acetyl-CoA synthetase